MEHLPYRDAECYLPDDWFDSAPVWFGYLLLPGHLTCRDALMPWAHGCHQRSGPSALYGGVCSLIACQSVPWPCPIVIKAKLEPSFPST